MTNEEAQKVLDELQGVRPEVLNGEAKRLFEAIMKIADNRDELKQEYDRDTHILQNQLDLANAKNIEKDKIIDLMAGLIKDHKILADKDCNVLTTKAIKQYFENKAKKRITRRNYARKKYLI